MRQLRFTNDHEWAQLDGNTVTIGITNFAQDQLGDLVFVELPAVGNVVAQGDEAAVIESVKAAADVKAPVSGTVIEINKLLIDEPEKVNSDPMGDGWFYKLDVTNSTEWDSLMDETAYKALVADAS